MTTGRAAGLPTRREAGPDGPRWLESLPVRQWMRHDPVVVRADVSTAVAVDLLRTRKIRHLTVVDAGGRLVGIVTDRDLRQIVFDPRIGEALGEATLTLAARLSGGIRTLERQLAVLLLAAGLVLSVEGCATGYLQGQADLRGGRPAEARRHFQDVLVSHPDRLDALAGLAVAEYKLGAYDRALPLFERVVARMTTSGAAHLYLALTHLQRGELERAAAFMTEARRLPLPARTAAHIDRAVPLLQTGLSDPARAFVAASLEGDLDWAAEVHDARTAPRARFEPTWAIYSDSHDVFPHVHGVRWEPDGVSKPPCFDQETRMTTDKRRARRTKTLI